MNTNSFTSRHLRHLVAWVLAFATTGAFAAEPAWPAAAKGSTYAFGRLCSVSGSDEVVVVRRHPNEWPVGSRQRLQVAEFVSGRRGQPTVTFLPEYRAAFVRGGRPLELDCAIDRQLPFYRDPGRPAGPDGAYLEQLNISPEGVLATDADVQVCRTAAFCDLGVRALAMKDREGRILWSRVYALRDRSRMGHPTFVLPGLPDIDTQGPREGVRLSDGTAVLAFARRSLRVSLRDGSIVGAPPDAVAVDAQEFARFKATHYRAFIDEDPSCVPSPPKACRRKYDVAGYFYGLRDYFFRE
jgi:hypothetical protein